ncbi:PH domain-containing protein [Paractinoplanes maris]|uniref:PH domain-containing protein n=1 Tax=Paractinoplanes maris TaxID=1734446 RepID=UPI0020223BA5|nr:PH domain-containing protein [Actinoplanes maris]
MRSKPLLRVRKSGGLMVAAVLGFVSGVPLASVSWAWALILLIPIAFFLWAWRAGTDVYADQLRVRALLGSTEVLWDRIDELAPDSSGQISALLDNGNVIRLTAVTTDNLPRVLAAGGQEIGHSD